MPVAVDLDRAQFRLAGSDLEPTDLAWTLATPAQRKGYWREVAVLARDRKFAELHKGIGVDGQRLPRRKAPRHDHAAGPVLSPHWSDSRFRTQLRWEGTDTGAILWWRSPWGRIVGYHARGEVRGAPVRNVIGLTAESQRWIRTRALKWWEGQVRTGRLGAGATTMGSDAAIVAAAQAAGTFSGWQRVAPPRPDLFRPLAPVRPVPVPAPTLTGALAPWQAIQRVHELWESAGHGKTTRAQLERTAARLGRTQTLPTLQAILVRWGVVQPPPTKAEAVELIRRNLLSRLMVSRPGRGPTPPPKPVTPPVVPPPPQPPPPVEPPKPVPAPEPKPAPKPKTLDDRLRTRIAAARQKQRDDHQPEDSASDWIKERFRLHPDLVQPNQDIKGRIRDYTWGDAKIKAIRELDQDRERQSQAIVARDKALQTEQSKLILERDQLWVEIGVANRERREDDMRTLTDKMNALAKQIRAIDAERDQLNAQVKALTDQLRARIAAVLALDPSERLDVRASPIAAGARSDDGPLEDLDGEIRDRVVAARAWIGSLTSLGDGPDAQTLLLRFGHAAGRRPHHNPNPAGYDIQLDTKEDIGTIAHEIAHAIDDRIKTVRPTRFGPETRRVLDATLEYLRHRVGNEAPEQLNNLFPGSCYEDSEKGRKDKLAEAFNGNVRRAYYAGKEYHGQASEMLSMGVQLLYDDPVGFAKRDPEYCKFVLGVLDGSLR